MKLSIIYPIKNRANYFDITLKYLLKTKVNRFDMEIIVIDCMSTDNLLEIIEKYKDEFNIQYYCIDIKLYTKYQVVDNNYFNPSYGWNLGIKKSKGGYIVITSPEVVPYTDVLLKLFNYINENNELIYMCTVQEVFEKNGDFLETGCCFYGKKSFAGGHVRSDSAGYYFFGAYPKFVLLDVCGIEENYMRGVGYDDPDFGNLLKLRKFKHIIMDDVYCYHIRHLSYYEMSEDICEINRLIYEKRKWKMVNSFITKNNVDIEWGSDECVINSKFYNL